MKKHLSVRSVTRRLALIAGIAGLASLSAQAVPYATGLTNTGSSISFRLNESADVVKVIYNGGGTTYNLGAQTAGVIKTNMVISGTFKIEVIKTAPAGYLQGTALQISSDDNRALQFEQPIGVAINNNPASPYFGRIYVANSRASATGTGRTAGDGIFVLNPDFTDALGQGDTALNGGIDLSDKSGANQNTTLPWRIEVGPDNNLYIADFTTNSGTIYVTDPNLTPGSGTNVLFGLGSPGISETAGFNHGQIASSPITTGSLATGDLTVYALDADVGTINGPKRWDVGAGPLPFDAIPAELMPYTAPLLQIARVIVDLDRGPSGKLYLSQYRSTGNESGLVVVDNQDVDQDGELDVLFASLGKTRELSGDFSAVDYLLNSYAIKVSPNGQYIAVARFDGPTWIIPLDANGIPQLADRISVATAPGGPSRDVCFDAAGNLYIVNNNIELLRAFSPGGRWVATTGSDGTFNVDSPVLAIPEISVAASSTNIYERVLANTAVVNVTRIGNIDSPLTVNLAISGNAVAGVDYVALPTSVVIPAGESSAAVTVTPINNTNLTGDRKVTVSVVANAAYTIVPTSGALSVNITDDEAPLGKVLFSDDFETDSSANYAVLPSQVGASPDFQVNWAYDYSAEGIPAAPHSTAGTKGVKLRVNKNFDGTATAEAAAVSLLPLGKNFSGDFALRGDVLLSVGFDLGGTTENSLFGINHSGTIPLRAGATTSDGLWFAVDSDGTDSIGFGFFGEASAAAPTLLKGNSAFTWAYPNPPYPYAGIPSVNTNSVTLTGSPKIWADFEARQVGGVVTMKLNNIPVFQFTNTYAFKNGTVMIGHNDRFASVGSLDSYALWDNLRVIDLSTKITEIKVSGANVLIDFITPTGGAFTNYSAASISGPFTPDAGTTYITNSPGVYRATTPVNGGARFYQIRRAPLLP